MGHDVDRRVIAAPTSQVYTTMRMVLSPFLTDIDERAAVKGSRDPLGIQAIWTRFGRHVIGNLTTVSTSVRDFTTLILGYWFVERVAETGEPDAALATFLKWEQLAAYARAFVNDDRMFRGVERVGRTLAEGPKVTISADRKHQILGDQKIYGLWGLYTVPARTSCLVNAEAPQLTPVAREMVERVYLPMLAAGGGRDAKAIVALLREPAARLDLQGRDAALVKAVASVLKRRILVAEREIYRKHLLFGGPEDATKGRQRELAELFAAPPYNASDFSFSPAAVADLAKRTRRSGGDERRLAYYLDRIRCCESLVAPAAVLFVFLLARDGSTVDDIARTVRASWGKTLTTLDVESVAALEAEISEVYRDVEAGKRWVQIASRLRSGEYADAIRLLLEQNRFVMKSRSGAAPWVDVQDGRLVVRFRDEGGDLPDREELPGLWRFPYFLDALRAVAIALKEG